MSLGKYLVCIAGLAGCASWVIALDQPALRVKLPARAATQSTTPIVERRRPHSGGNYAGIPPPDSPATFRTRRGPAAVSLPVSMEENVGQAAPGIALIGRGRALTTLLTGEGMEVIVGTRPSEKGTVNPLKLQLVEVQRKRRRRRTRKRRSRRRSRGRFAWQGEGKLRGESNYFLGSDPGQWHTHVGHFERAEAKDVVSGVSVVAYGNEEGIEYDLVLARGVDTDTLRLKVSGADAIRLDAEGNLLLRVGPGEVQMRKPAIYQKSGGSPLQDRGHPHKPQNRRPVDGGYLLYADGTIGFRVGPHDDGAALVVDPSLSVAYSTFLGGTGEDSANSIALDLTGNLYVGGTTASSASFPEAGSKRIGPAGGAKEFFIAKIDPTASGSNSLIYLTFLGGSTDQVGGLIAVDSSGDVAITGTTTSVDYPVTDGSKRTAGSNDMAVTEIDPTGSTLIFSTMFGGSGAESTQGAGGIALDASGDIFIASDTNSMDLTTTTGAYQIGFGGGTTDGFLAEFRPMVTPHLEYCTYLGINAQVGIGGVAVDAGGNAYIVGSTSNPGNSFPTLNGFQGVYGGDPSDGFLVKIRPSGTGATDLAYGTFLGGAALDKALAVALSVAMPATAYVTGTTQSANFPMNGTIAGPQTSLKGTANAFLAVVAQNAATGMTSLVYSTYLGGSESDTGLGVAAPQANEVYVTGNAGSFDFPWEDNFQPFNGDVDAFVAKIDSTMAGAASLVYATPLGGTGPPGVSTVANGNGIAADGAGHVYLTGRTTAADFPRAGGVGNGFQLLCTSCQASPPAADAFVIAIQENTSAAPSASFTQPRINFGQQIIGAQNIPPLFAGVTNTGDAPLNVASLGIVGPNSPDFSLILTEACMSAPILPGASCSFEVSYQPSVVGAEVAFMSLADDAPGSPQLLEIEGTGGGPLAVLTPPSQDFGSVQVGSSSGILQMNLVNTGNQNLTISNFAKSGPGALEFDAQDISCTPQSIIPAQGNCLFNVVFTPTGTGIYSAEIDITDDSGGMPGTRQVIPITGTGTAPAPLVNLLPGTLTFGGQAVGTTSVAQVVTLNDVGETPLTMTGIAIAGNDAVNFAIIPNAGSKPCPVAGGVLAIGASCTVSVTFTPLSSGTKNAILNFADNASGSPQTVAISGTGVAPMIQLSVTSLSFASQSVGTGTSQTVTVTSAGNSPVGFNSINMSGVNAGDFSETNTCFPSIGSPGSCIISVTFNPTAPGIRSATLSLLDNAMGSPQMVGLTGVATAAGVLLSPTSVNFSGQLVGAPSPPVSITVKNTGQGALVINAISPSSFIGTNARDFSEKDNCSGTVAPSAACTIQVTFTPGCSNSSLSRTATLNLTDNAPSVTQTISLTGTPTGNFCLAVPAGGTTSATVAAGQTATYRLDVISMNKFAGSVGLSCAGAPPESQCTATPATAALTPNSALPFQINVSTTATSQTASMASRSNSDRPASSGPRGRVAPSPPLPVGLIVLLVAIVTTKMRSPCKHKPTDLIYKCATILLIASSLATCGGNGTGPTLNPGTPAGTSILNISVTSSATGGQMTLTLVLTVTPNGS